MSQPEARLARTIRHELEQRGVFVFKVHGSSMMMAGLPDLIGCHKGRFIAIECKMPGNTTSRIQDLIHSRIKAAGGRVIVAYSVADALKVLRD